VTLALHVPCQFDFWRKSAIFSARTFFDLPMLGVFSQHLASK